MEVFEGTGPDGDVGRHFGHSFGRSTGCFGLNAFIYKAEKPPTLGSSSENARHGKFEFRSPTVQCLPLLTSCKSQPATMTVDGETKTRLRTLYLDGSFLELNPGEEAFFKAETGIQDTEELRKHIVGVQEEAYKVSRCSHVNWVSYHGAVPIMFRFTRILAFAGLDSRNPRSPGCLCIRASSS